jgi:ATP-binding cassette subfamily C (CFTR/MRP) protein 4
MSLIEEMEILGGKIEVNGTVFYLAQEPWIFPATVRQNILFGKDFNKEKYDRILRECCLDKVLTNYCQQKC